MIEVIRAGPSHSPRPQAEISSSNVSSLTTLLAETSLETATSTPSEASTGIVTHAGPHHADEALAVYLLRKIPRFSNLKLTRTRDQALIDKAVVVVDVGHEYDPERLRFDHHQNGFEETFDAAHGIKLSSAGLIWKHFGKEIISNVLKLEVASETVKTLWLTVYDDYIEAIDALDNGVLQFSNPGKKNYTSDTSIGRRVKILNPHWNEEADDSLRMERFEKASKLIGDEVVEHLNFVYRVEMPAEEEASEAFRARKSVEGGDPGGKILVLKRHLSWKRTVTALNLTVDYKERVHCIVSPNRADSDWHVQINRFGYDRHKKEPESFPKAWCGSRDEELVRMTGIEGARYVHACGHIAGARDRTSALALAHRFLEHEELKSRNPEPQAYRGRGRPDQKRGGYGGRGNGARGFRGGFRSH